MTLKQKFFNVYTSYYKKSNELDKMVEIADNYAIEFAEWCIEWRVEFCDSTKEGILYTYGGMYQKYKMQELLKIFKKEKGF
jgi:hypothetical protein